MNLPHTPKTRVEITLGISPVALQKSLSRILFKIFYITTIVNTIEYAMQSLKCI